MNRVIELLRDKKKELETENAFDEQMLEENRGTDHVKQLRMNSVESNQIFIGQINRTLILIKQQKLK